VATLARADLLSEPAPALPRLSGIATDSRTVEAGALFVAVRGSQEDGHRFAADAVARGAAALAVERRLDMSLPQLVVRDGRLAAIALARAWFDDPARRLALAGVTGTSGKTTTALLLRHLLNAAGTAGCIGTLGAVDGAGRPVPSTAGSLTTPGPVDLQATLAELVARGAEWVAMEASSHSLDQGRLDGLAFAAAVFTNLSREHLDYHETMDRYHAAKLGLLRLLAPRAVVAVNRDDPAWAGIGESAGVVSYGLGPDAALRGRELALGAAGTRFVVEGRFGRAEASLPLPGEFNVRNALAAGAAAIGLGQSLADVVERWANAPQVPGRMERIAEEPCAVLRDYAHKPDALERVLRSLRPLTPGRLIVLFGCGGDRDRGKRPIMGRIAAELADLAIVTSDNPRTEDPERILDEIVAGVPAGTAVERMADRRAAIGWALDLARPGDTLLLAGKGHETYQTIGREQFPFDERAIVLRHLGREP
jgi:UDP-N-acetylmuramoyl-L-alanyl-D-glutamate--2,6-diaminopimelate ligase